MYVTENIINIKFIELVKCSILKLNNKKTILNNWNFILVRNTMEIKLKILFIIILPYCLKILLIQCQELRYNNVM